MNKTGVKNILMVLIILVFLAIIGFFAITQTILIGGTSINCQDKGSYWSCAISGRGQFIEDVDDKILLKINEPTNRDTFLKYQCSAISENSDLTCREQTSSEPTSAYASYVGITFNNAFEKVKVTMTGRYSDKKSDPQTYIGNFEATGECQDLPDRKCSINVPLDELNSSGNLIENNIILKASTIRIDFIKNINAVEEQEQDLGEEPTETEETEETQEEDTTETPKQAESETEKILDIGLSDYLLIGGALIFVILIIVMIMLLVKR